MCRNCRRKDVAVIGTTAELPVVDGLELPEPQRQLLRPGELMITGRGEVHRLPRFFYKIESHAAALTTRLTPNFGVWEFIDVDVREPAVLRAYPRYVPCAVTILAIALELFREAVGAPVRIAANGGYRSPSHSGSQSGSPHCWAAAANIYRVGAEYLDTEERIRRFAAVASRSIAVCWTRPYGSALGEADDHLHLDLGYVTMVPREQSEESRAS
jgi:hypothetical protein